MGIFGQRDSVPRVDVAAVSKLVNMRGVNDAASGNRGKSVGG